MAIMETPVEPVKLPPLYWRPEVRRLLLIALMAEIAYAVLNISTMPIYLAAVPPPGIHLIPNGRGFGASVIGLVLVAFLLSEAVFKSPMGHLADKFGPKTLMLVGPAISFGTTIVTLLLPNLGATPFEVLIFVLLRALDGVGAAMLWPAAFSAINEVVPDDERQQAMSWMNLCYMLGIALAFPLGGIANDMSGVKWAGLVLAGVLFFTVSLSVWKFVPRLVIHDHTALEQVDHGIQDFIRSIRQIPTYLLLSLITFAGVGFPMAIFKLFPVDQFGYSETQIGLLILPGALIMAAASVPMSKFGERIGRIRAVHFGMGLCAAGMCLIASGAFVPLLRQPWLLAVGGIPVGVGFLMAIPAWMANVSDIDPQRRGTNIGAVMTAQGLGAIIGAPIGAAMYEKMGPVGLQIGLGEGFGRYSPFVGCAICITFGWLLSLRILREPRG
jgi:DHA1 family multidrug resistance protein-like MFS transporter